MSANSFNRLSPRRPRIQLVLPLLLLIAMTALSLYIARQVAQQEQNERQTQFNTTSLQVAQLLQEKINQFPQLLKATRGMVINQDYRPDNDQWQLFFNSLNLDYRALGIIGFTFTEYVDHNDRDKFLSHNKAIYGEQFHIFPPTEQDEYFVVMQAVPDSVISRIRGYNIASEARRNEAAQYAKNSGQIAITTPISLLPTDKNSLDYLMLAPVYADAEQPDSGLFLDSDIIFSGWITVGFSLSQLIQQSIHTLAQPLRLQVYDPRTVTGTISYDSESGDPTPSQQRFQRAHTLDIGDEPLELIIMPAANGLISLSTYNHEVLLISLLTSLLAAVSLRQVLNTRHNALYQADRMLERSRETTSRYQTLFEQSPEAIIIHINRGIVLCNKSALRLLGTEHSSDLVGQNILQRIHPDSHNRMELRLQALERGEQVPPAEKRFLRLDGSHFLAELNSAQVSYDGQPAIQLMFRDVTAARESLNQARIAQRVLEHTREAIMVTDLTGNIVMVNPAFSELTGYSRVDVLQQTPALLASGQHPPIFFRKLWRTLINTGNWTGEIINRRKNGEAYIQQTNVSAVYNRHGKISHFVCLMGDITEQKKTMDSIRFQATHDNLTRLANRSYFESQAAIALQEARQSGELLAVMFLDIDGFKPVNDIQGHATGDRLLIAIAERLYSTLNETIQTDDSLLSRIGGDEFLILVRHLSSVEDATKLGEQILITLEKPVEVDGLQLQITASIGLALSPQNGTEIGLLIDMADRAMYHAKRQGKNQLQIAVPPVTPAI
ncbi:MAG: diguanylate cyclase [Marinobacterium sp.]|nr:diguanylate cyclase [Marinobacterium sp.]